LHDQFAEAPHTSNALLAESILFNLSDRLIFVDKNPMGGKRAMVFNCSSITDLCDRNFSDERAFFHLMPSQFSFIAVTNRMFFTPFPENDFDTSNPFRCHE
jgi:hypothetical protein